MYRSRMQSGKIDNAVQTEFGWWEIGQTFPADMVCEVLESKAKGYKAGDWIRSMWPLQQYFVATVVSGESSNNQFKMAPQKVDKDVPLEKNFSLVSVTGCTALAALERCMEPEASRYKNSSCFLDILRKVLPCGGMCGSGGRYNFKGKTCVVTSASSGIGCIVGQVLKFKGAAKVIGITSTKAKGVQLLDLGYDSTIAYKEEDVDQRLKELAPEGVDFDYEMCGGPVFDAVIRSMNKFGKAVVVGNMHDADRHHKDCDGIKEVGALVGKSIELTGFFIIDYREILPFYFIRMAMMAKKGQLKSHETIIRGFENWGHAIEQIHSGEKFGQTVVVCN